MKIWIDLSNSPHPLLFAPVVRRLRDEGHDVLLTARDNAQTVQLAAERWPEVEVIGGESPRGRAAKASTMAGRVRELRRWAAARRPDVALSHNSYAQILAAALRQVPIVTAMDFEHQPANHLAFRLASKVLLPDAIPLRHVQRQGARPSKVVRYHGLKEELYIGDFNPDPSIFSQIGLDRRPRTVVVFRTPPSRALYHQFGNPVFTSALEMLSAQPDTVCVVLARHSEQREALSSRRLPGCLVPRHAIDSRSLVYASDAMIGAGGTMTREAALMGIPTWSVFAGRPAAVDLWLERQGRLTRLADATQLGDVGPRPTAPRELRELWESARAIESAFVSTTVCHRMSWGLEVQPA